MSQNNGGKKIVKIEERPAAPKAPEGTDNNGQNPGETEDQKIKFWKHPIKWTKNQFEEHPVRSTVASVGLLGALTFAGKCIADAFGGGESTESEDENLEDFDDEEDEDDEEEI